MEKTLTLIEVQTGVRKLTQFEKTKEDLEKMVAVSSKITVSDISNEKQIAIVKKKRIELRKVEIDIEKQGKGYRDVFNAVNKEISAKEKELKAITTPEIERLSDIEETAEKMKLKIKREVLLPARKERLLAIDPKGCYVCADEYLIEMDAVGFEKYLNDCKANKNERDQIRAIEKLDRKREEEERKLAKERANLEAEKKEEDRKREEDNAKIKAEQDKIDEANRQIEKDRLELEHQKELKKAEDNAKIKAEQDAKLAKERREAEEIAEAERVAKVEKERRELQEKREDYKKWLVDNKFSQTTHKIIEMETEFVMYKKVSSFKK